MQKDRSSNIELLRIVAMLFIIMGHFIRQGGGTELPNLKVWSAFLGSGARIATNVFLMVGAWYLVDSGFRAKQIVKLEFTNLFYTSVLTIIMFVIGVTHSYKDIIRGFFPFFAMTNWFVKLYICLLLLSPFLKKILLWEERKQRSLLYVLTFLIPFTCTFFGFMDTYLDNLFYFVYVYLLIGYVKKYINGNEVFKNRYWLLLLIAICLYAALVVLGKIIPEENGLTAIVRKVGQQYLMDFKSIPNIVISLSIVLFVVNHDFGSKKWINYLSANTLAVYCFHQVPCFYEFLWKNILRCNYFWNQDYAFIYTIIATLLVFFFATFVDKIRCAIFKNVYNTKGVNKLCNTLGSIYSRF